MSNISNNSDNKNMNNILDIDIINHETNHENIENDRSFINKKYFNKERNEITKKYFNKDRNFIITDKSDCNFEEDFEDKDYYDMYMNNKNFNIMEMAEILIMFPEKLCSIICKLSNIPKKEIRGYSEYKKYVKSHNNLCREIYSRKDEELRLHSKIKYLASKVKYLIEQKQIAKEEKINKKKEYNLFMIEKMGSASLPSPDVLKI